VRAGHRVTWVPNPRSARPRGARGLQRGSSRRLIAYFRTRSGRIATLCARIGEGLSCHPFEWAGIRRRAPSTMHCAIIRWRFLILTLQMLSTTAQTYSISCANSISCKHQLIPSPWQGEAEGGG